MRLLPGLTAALLMGSAATLAPAAVAAEAPDSPPARLAAGVIVGLDRVAPRALLSLRQGLPSSVHVRLASTEQAVLRFERPSTVEEAGALAQEVARRPGVAWAEPDLLLRRMVDPVLPDDARFDDQWALWDPPASRDYGLQAALGWTATRGGSEVLVAVLDTGWTDHPDLDGQVIDGYDFVSDVPMANDGDGRDGDAHDPGDWVTDAESRGYFEGCEPSASSWHGTHVAGTVVARQGNRIGVSGVAPRSRVLAVRVLGKCAGSTSDIADGMIWAAGGHVRGVPDNPNPAQVISLSLGGSGGCGNAFRNAVNYAQRQGVTVVVAAGNEGKPISSSSPANCDGVIPVVATNPDGKRPSWSNYGTRSLPAVITAPGVDIVSTYNSGERGPQSPSYESASGTSMATPHVAGVVALLRSLGVAPGDVVERLQQLVRPFPRSGSGQVCDRTSCGPGLLNLSALATQDPGPDPDPGPGPSPDPGGDPTMRPTIVGPVTVSYAVRGPVATATVRWGYAPPAGEPKATLFRYRVRLAGGSWTPWKDTPATSIRIADVPRGRLSLAEIAGINARGIGPTYQATLFPN